MIADEDPEDPRTAAYDPVAAEKVEDLDRRPWRFVDLRQGLDISIAILGINGGDVRVATRGEGSPPNPKD
ncbi:hypothetical protein FRB94_011675 [Tulasnella sp. JGI-2019a]|nr:hypothetical protein FRB94_011675 [Tulasnella sp. JGI-2019a]